MTMKISKWRNSNSLTRKLGKILNRSSLFSSAPPGLENQHFGVNTCININVLTTILLDLFGLQSSGAKHILKQGIPLLLTTPIQVWIVRNSFKWLSPRVSKRSDACSLTSQEESVKSTMNCAFNPMENTWVDMSLSMLLTIISITLCLQLRKRALLISLLSSTQNIE